jgi:hypothetical protein
LNSAVATVAVETVLSLLRVASLSFVMVFFLFLSFAGAQLAPEDPYSLYPRLCLRQTRSICPAVATEQSMLLLAARWIASLRSQ